jgi:L-alanine-DL-glutamate epimerase-like enolase superfamily enzyme
MKLSKKGIIMQIKDIKAVPLSVKLKIPYQSAKKAEVVSQTNLNTVVIEVICDDGTKGYGEAAFPLKIPETPEMVAKLFESRVRSMLVNENPFNIEYILRKVSKSLKLRNFVLAAIDLALHDIVGKTLGVPVYELLGGIIPGKRAIPSSLIPLVSPEEAGRIAEEYLRNGVTVLKMKVGDDPTMDVEKQ